MFTYAVVVTAFLVSALLYIAMIKGSLKAFKNINESKTKQFESVIDIAASVVEDINELMPETHLKKNRLDLLILRNQLMQFVPYTYRTQLSEEVLKKSFKDFPIVLNDDKEYEYDHPTDYFVIENVSFKDRD